jgi:HD-like signal output (HDOD) protein
VSSIENAVRLIGENGLRMMLAKVAFRPVIRDQFGTQTKHLSPYIWQQSELCGLVAQKLAEREKHDPFMAFLAGLVSNVGMIVALRIADRMSTQFFLQGESAFQMQVLKQARQISAHVAQQWEFPSGVVLALQEQIGISENSLALSMANIVRHANHISQICVLRSRGVRQADEANLKRVCDTRMCKDVELFYREFQKIQAGK